MFQWLLVCRNSSSTQTIFTLFVTLSSSVILIFGLVFQILRAESSSGHLLTDIASFVWTLDIIVPMTIAIFVASSIKEKVSWKLIAHTKSTNFPSRPFSIKVCRGQSFRKWFIVTTIYCARRFLPLKVFLLFIHINYFQLLTFYTRVENKPLQLSTNLFNVDWTVAFSVCILTF